MEWFKVTPFGKQEAPKQKQFDAGFRQFVVSNIDNYNHF
jgi:hypothetical protein